MVKSYHPGGSSREALQARVAAATEEAARKSQAHGLAPTVVATGGVVYTARSDGRMVPVREAGNLERAEQVTPGVVAMSQRRKGPNAAALREYAQRGQTQAEVAAHMSVSSAHVKLSRNVVAGPGFDKKKTASV